MGDVPEQFASRAKKLKAIKTFCATTRALDAMFATPKTALETLFLSPFSGLDKKVVGKMMSSLSNLRILKFHIFEPDHVELSCAVLYRCSSLRRFEGDNRACSMRDDFDGFLLLRAMKECEKLKYINLGVGCIRSDEERLDLKRGLRDADPFRFRRVQIRVHGFDLIVPPTHVYLLR